MSWDLKFDRPIYLQLMEHIGYRIVSGEYGIGSKLPSVRDLAAEASVNPNTMQKALSELERSGLIFTNRTSGRFVTEDAAMIGNRKLAMAKDQLNIFFEQLRNLGFTPEEVKAFILAEIEQEN